MVKASVIIPVRAPTDYLRETINCLKKQSCRDFELLVVTDRKVRLDGAKVIVSGQPGPAYKRNLAAFKAKGEILAFLDDDSYPSPDWLKRALAVFKQGQQVTAVCGPCLTPPADNLLQRASGEVWSCWLGSGGAGTYRNKICRRREVTDFPSVNLLVRKKDFADVKGFAEEHWPGEDTKLCLDLINLGKKIIYDPGVLVYHHRRPVFMPHLKQISRYAQRRGFFAKKFPQTSFTLGYWMPTLFTAGLIIGAIMAYFFPFIRQLYFIGLGFYLLLLLVTGIKILIKERNFSLAVLSMVAVLATHLCYGILFPCGYLKKDLGVIPHRINKKTGNYIGG